LKLKINNWRASDGSLFLTLLLGGYYAD